MVSLLLVLLQFLLIGVIAYPFSAPAAGIAAMSGAALFLAGLAVFLAAALAMKRKSFSVMPEPKAGAELVTRGIYARVRHPMYLSVLLCAAGACLIYGAPWKWMAAALLFLVLWIKLRREERLLVERYPEYAQYRGRSRALFPFLL